MSEELVRTLHLRQLSEHGGLDGLRDGGMLSSALMRPRQLHAYGDPPPDLFALAAAYAFGLARNHPCLDGNKRSAAVVSETFLLRNGVELNATDVEVVLTFLSLAAGELTEDELAAWLRGHGQPIAK